MFAPRLHHLTGNIACLPQAMTQEMPSSLDNTSTRADAEALLGRLKVVAGHFPAHQALACRMAFLQLQLSMPADAITTAQPFVETKTEVAPAAWAAHLNAHACWLCGRVTLV